MKITIFILIIITSFMINIKFQNKYSSEYYHIKKSKLYDVDWKNFKPLNFTNGKVPILETLYDPGLKGHASMSIRLFNVCYGDFNNDKIEDALVITLSTQFHSSGSYYQDEDRDFYSTKAGKIIKIKVKNKDKIDLKKLNCIYKKQ